MSTNPNNQPKQPYTFATYAAFAAAAINTVLFFLFMATGLIDPNIMVNGKPLSILPVLFSSIVPTYVAAFFFVLICRYAKHPWRLYRTIAIILLLLSFMNPIAMIKDVTVPMIIALDLMHVVVVGCIFYFFPKSLAADSETAGAGQKAGSF